MKLDELLNLNTEDTLEERYTDAREYLRHWDKEKRLWVYGHREALGIDENEGKIVHHKNGDKHDNRKSNLQLVSRAEHCKIDPNARKYYKCKKKGCDGVHYQHGLCLKHFMQKYRKGEFGNYDKTKNYSKKTRKKSS